MREIINISSGNCGNSLGLNFWESINHEHGVGPDGRFQGSSDLQLERIYVYYHEGYSANQFIPRNIAVDLDPAKIDSIKGSPLGGIFPASHTICGRSHSGGSNNFAKGYFSDGVSLLPEVMECLRHEVETSDAPQGIQMCHALGGGTGAGLSALILDAARDAYPELITPTFSVFPSPKVSEIVVEPYNAILAMSHLLSSVDMIFCLDNQALLNSCLFGLRIATPTYGDLNHIIANAMSGITTSLRFPGQLNTGLRKLATNTVPFPRYQWFIPSFVPLIPRAKRGEQKNTPLPHHSIREMVRNMFDDVHSMCDVDMTKGKFLTASAIFRGRMSTSEVENNIMQVRRQNSSSFVPWIPDNMKTSICDIPPRGLSKAATCFANNSAISELMFRLLRQYRPMFRRQAFLHWYYGEGMEEQDFIDAETTVKDIAQDYSRIHFATRPEDDSSDDEWPKVEDSGVKKPPGNFNLRHSDDKIEETTADANNSSSYKDAPRTKTTTTTTVRASGLRDADSHRRKLSRRPPTSPTPPPPLRARANRTNAWSTRRRPNDDAARRHAASSSSTNGGARMETLRPSIGAADVDAAGRRDDGFDAGDSRGMGSREEEEDGVVEEVLVEEEEEDFRNDRGRDESDYYNHRRHYHHHHRDAERGFDGVSIRDDFPSPSAPLSASRMPTTPTEYAPPPPPLSDETIGRPNPRRTERNPSSVDEVVGAKRREREAEQREPRRRREAATMTLRKKTAPVAANEAATVDRRDFRRVNGAGGRDERRMRAALKDGVVEREAKDVPTMDRSIEFVDDLERRDERMRMASLKDERMRMASLKEADEEARDVSMVDRRELERVYDAAKYKERTNVLYPALMDGGEAKFVRIDDRPEIDEVEEAVARDEALEMMASLKDYDDDVVEWDARDIPTVDGREFGRVDGPVVRGDRWRMASLEDAADDDYYREPEERRFDSAERGGEYGSVAKLPEGKDEEEEKGEEKRWEEDARRRDEDDDDGDDDDENDDFERRRSSMEAISDEKPSDGRNLRSPVPISDLLCGGTSDVFLLLPKGKEEGEEEEEEDVTKEESMKLKEVKERERREGEEEEEKVDEEEREEEKPRETEEADGNEESKRSDHPCCGPCSKPYNEAVQGERWERNDDEDGGYGNNDFCRGPCAKPVRESRGGGGGGGGGGRKMDNPIVVDCDSLLFLGNDRFHDRPVERRTDRRGDLKFDDNNKNAADEDDDDAFDGYWSRDVEDEDVVERGWYDDRVAGESGRDEWLEENVNVISAEDGEGSEDDDDEQGEREEEREAAERELDNAGVFGGSWRSSRETLPPSMRKDGGVESTGKDGNRSNNNDDVTIKMFLSEENEPSSSNKAYEPRPTARPSNCKNWKGRRLLRRPELSRIGEEDDEDDETQ